MSGIFDIIDLIHSKERYPSQDELKEYKSFVGNRAMSQHQDLIFHANEMNNNYGIPDSANFAFYFFSISKKKRYASWAKKGKSNEEEKIAALKETFGYSDLKCRDIIPIIDDLGLWSSIKADLDKGGLVKSKKRSTSKNNK